MTTQSQEDRNKAAKHLRSARKSEGVTRSAATSLAESYKALAENSEWLAGESRRRKRRKTVQTP